MEYRAFGKTGLKVGVLGFGAGAVGGLMVRGSAADQDRAVGIALDAGINYFDTAPQYGMGESEKNLGRVMNARKMDVVLGTKVRIPPETKGSIAAEIPRAMNESLTRLSQDHVELYQLHNPITESGEGDGNLNVTQVLEEVIPAFQTLQRAGKIRFFGITAIGDTSALHKVISSGLINSAQISYNMLNPSAGGAMPLGYPAQDYAGLLNLCQQHGVGTVGIRALAGGALTGTDQRHPVASAPPEPIGSSLFYDRDLARAKRFMPVVAEGHTGSLLEAALRFPIAHPALSTMLFGIATVEEFQSGLAAGLKGPLPAAALARLAELRAGFMGETR
ncbi:MAG: aldo/keto reductase [Acetobacteraceae bacterium]|nr:aldo/keto reductase [Acetobacteraceae bacterium]